MIRQVSKYTISEYTDEMDLGRVLVQTNYDDEKENCEHAQFYL